MKRMMLAFIILLSWSVSVVAGAEYNESNVMLYYNPTGGTRYHADMNCPSASEKYLPLAGSFSWDQLYDHPYIDLLPCSICNAPQREGGQISKNGPDVWVKVATVGNEEDGKVTKEAAVMRPDGSILQRLTYLANNDTWVPLYQVCLQDINGDGYSDLLLLTAQGASNVFYAVCMWNPETGSFNDPLQRCAFDFENTVFSEEISQFEVVNLITANGMMVSTENDGAIDRYISSYVWEGLTPAPWYWASITSHGDDITERFGYGSNVIYTYSYPHGWYDSSHVYNERSSSILKLMYESDAVYAVVSNVDWVHLRKQDSKSSDSIAKLNKGTPVRVLATDCGDDKGWIRVYVEDFGEWKTGYIWHSYLEKQ